MNQNKKTILLLIMSFVIFSFLVFDVHANDYNDPNSKTYKKIFK